ncbi:MAG: xanthine dehydrogenase family protein subunit M [Acidobacteria bacterium]|nr:xanthine dehydrogenase family protein subunit M [Acidobacteriota bacterium]
MTALSKFSVITPKTLDEALDALASVPAARPLAGGTDLMVQLEAGILEPCTFLNIQDLPELRTNSLSALTTYRDVRTGPLGKQFPMLRVAAREVGALAIQSRGTWVGNIANASPAADGVPALMAYDAELEIASKRGLRRTPLATFYRGYKKMDLAPDELITAVHLPPPAWDATGYFRKVGTRRFQAISKTLLAARIQLDSNRRIQDIRMILASVAPFTLRAFQTESLIRGRHLTPELIEEAAAAIQDEIHPIDDIRSTEMYRRQVTSNLVREFLGQAAAS